MKVQIWIPCLVSALWFWTISSGNIQMIFHSNEHSKMLLYLLISFFISCQVRTATLQQYSWHSGGACVFATLCSWWNEDSFLYTVFCPPLKTSESHSCFPVKSQAQSDCTLSFVMQHRLANLASDTNCTEKSEDRQNPWGWVYFPSCQWQSHYKLTLPSFAERFGHHYSSLQ